MAPGMAPRSSSTPGKRPLAVLSMSTKNELPRQYLLITGNYWAFTLTDGALRMLVLLHFHQLGYSPMELALLFLFYGYAEGFVSALWTLAWREWTGVAQLVEKEPAAV